MRLAFVASKLRHTSRSAEKSMHPRWRAFSSAVRTNRCAASPDSMGMLLIARAISNFLFAVYYSKKSVRCGELILKSFSGVPCTLSYIPDGRRHRMRQKIRRNPKGQAPKGRICGQVPNGTFEKGLRANSYASANGRGQTPGVGSEVMPFSTFLARYGVCGGASPRMPVVPVYTFYTSTRLFLSTHHFTLPLPHSLTPSLTHSLTIPLFHLSTLNPQSARRVPLHGTAVLPTRLL